MVIQGHHRYARAVEQPRDPVLNGGERYPSQLTAGPGQDYAGCLFTDMLKDIRGKGFAQWWCRYFPTQRVHMPLEGIDLCAYRRVMPEKMVHDAHYALFFTKVQVRRVMQVYLHRQVLWGLCFGEGSCSKSIMYNFI